MMKNRYPISKLSKTALTAAILSFITIVLGGVLRSLQGTGTCPDWPACYGSYLPPQGAQALIDYAHRAGTLLLVPALVVLFWMIRRDSLRKNRLSLAAGGTLLLVVLQGALGGWIALTAAPNRPGFTAIHLTLSLLMLASLLYITVVSFYSDHRETEVRESGRIDASRPAFRSRFARLTLVTASAAFLLLISGALVSGTGIAEACPSWPLCNGSLIPQTGAEWLNMIHRAIVLGTGFLVAYMFWKSWRSQRSQTVILAASTSAGVLFFAQALMGGLKVAQDFPPYMMALHQAASTAVWVSLLVQATAVGMARRTDEEEQAEEAESIGRKGLARDFLMLTKPIVVLLLLVTTFTGMVIGTQSWPSFSLVFWTLIGGAMAAGGSGAINQYIDREDDIRMQRTSKRPIPSGRLTAGEGLAFGIALCLASFFLLVAFVNLLAALLSLAGIIYYVLLYSIFLKKASVQNIVIGGGAGAIPPLVGWAAATGSLNIPSLFLFALIFMWTPPHFWALAIVRKNDYARAGVPMLPVVRGEREARKQILIYTVELVALTLLLPVIGLGGSIYLVSAAALGLWLLSAAYKLWRVEGNKVAWKMYRYSSMYLAFLFVALMIDRLILK